MEVEYGLMSSPAAINTRATFVLDTLALQFPLSRLSMILVTLFAPIMSDLIRSQIETVERF